MAGQQFEYDYDDIGNRKYAGSGGNEWGSNLRYENYTANTLNQYTQRTVPGAVDVLGAANTSAMILTGNASYWGYPFEARISVDGEANVFIAALKGNQLDFDVLDSAGAVAVECRAQRRPGFLAAFRAPGFLIKDIAGKAPTIALNHAGWMSARITWNGHESMLRLCSRQEHIESLGVERNVERKSFRAVCAKTTSTLATHRRSARRKRGASSG